MINTDVTRLDYIIHVEQPIMNQSSIYIATALVMLSRVFKQPCFLTLNYIISCKIYFALFIVNQFGFNRGVFYINFIQVQGTICINNYKIIMKSPSQYFFGKFISGFCPLMVSRNYVVESGQDAEKPTLCVNDTFGLKVYIL